MNHMSIMFQPELLLTVAKVSELQLETSANGQTSKGSQGFIGHFPFLLFPPEVHLHEWTSLIPTFILIFLYPFYLLLSLLNCNKAWWQFICAELTKYINELHFIIP